MTLDPTTPPPAPRRVFKGSFKILNAAVQVVGIHWGQSAKAAQQVQALGKVFLKSSNASSSFKIIFFCMHT